MTASIRDFRIRDAALPCMILLMFTAASAQEEFVQTSLNIEVFRLLDDSVLSITSRSWLADTGSIVVPEHRRKPDSRTITLPVHRIRALQELQKGLPVFWLGGGPGQTNMHTFQYKHFIEHHDHVMVGYRGVDGSVSLDCPEIVELLEQAGDILSDDVIEAIAQGYSSCAERLVGDGVDIEGYTPLEVAQDLEAARVALGYEKIILIAESYGTRIAYVYAQLYPHTIERMVMIGANPPGRMVWDPYQNDRLIQRYAAMWKQDASATDRYPDLEEAIRTVEDDFPESWLFLPIHKGTVRASMNAFLFHTETAIQGFDAYVAAAKGDPSGLWLISFVGSGIFPTVVNWGDNAAKAMSSDFEPGTDYIRTLDPPDALFGAPLGAFLWSSAGTSAWPVARMPEEYRSVRETMVHTLFISGSIDMSTPAENVETDLLPYFPNGIHVLFAEAGHILDLWRSQPAATRALIHGFIDGGGIDTSLVRYRPVSFSVAWGFPVLAKLAVGVVMVLVVVLVGGVFFGIRRFRRGRSTHPRPDQPQ